MRWSFKAMITAVVAVVALNLAVGQQPQIPGLPFGKGQNQPTDPIALLHNASVKKELRLTDPQIAKVDDAVWTALAAVLDAEQVKRLRQIELQQKNYMAFADPKVQAQLKMSEEQKEDVELILKDAAKELENMFAGGGFGKGKKNDPNAPKVNFADQMAAVNRKIKDQCTQVLNQAQKRIWYEMIGDEFTVEMPKAPKGKGKKAGA